MKAKDFLLRLRANPLMFAINKEAFCAQALTALIMDDIEFDCQGAGSSTGNFYAKHIGRQGSAIVGHNELFDNEWAQAVVDDALSVIKDCKMTPQKDSHCSYCGARFTEQVAWPRKCFSCWNESFKNPIPIVVALVPIHYREPTDLFQRCSWLVEQRNIEPEKGGWAFPSGYMEFNESWQEAVVRELQEEVGITTKPTEWSLFKIVKSPQGNMLIFCLHQIGVYQDEIDFSPNHEVSALQFPVHPEDIQLCFPSHNEMWAQLLVALS